MVKETQQTIITDPDTNTEKPFTFDFSYNSFVEADDPEHASQDTVWNDIGVRVSFEIQYRQPARERTDEM